MAKVFAMAKQLTANAKYDSLVMDYGAPYNRFTLSHDTTLVIAGLERILETLRFNWPLLTSEVKFTDRVYIPGSNLLMGMYTGHFGAGYEFPAHIVSWKNTGKDVAVFVQQGDKHSFRSLLYNFGTPKEIGMRTWQLSPGLYKVKIGTDQNNDGIADDIITSMDVELTERVNDIPLQIPSGKTLIIEVEQVRPSGAIKQQLPDLAIHARDIKITKATSGYELSTLVHNIGSRVADAFEIALMIDGKEVAKLHPGAIASPDNLSPQMKPVIFPIKPFKGNVPFMIVIRNTGPEITALNNKVKGMMTANDDGIRVSF
jgi:hypothetical protein